MDHQKYEYSDLITNKGERVDIDQLNDVGEVGWKLAGTREFTWVVPGATNSEAKVQLIFMRKVPTEQFPS